MEYLKISTEDNKRLLSILEKVIDFIVDNTASGLLKSGESFHALDRENTVTVRGINHDMIQDAIKLQIAIDVILKNCPVKERFTTRINKYLLYFPKTLLLILTKIVSYNKHK